MVIHTIASIPIISMEMVGTTTTPITFMEMVMVGEIIGGIHGTTTGEIPGGIIIKQITSTEMVGTMTTTTALALTMATTDQLVHHQPTAHPITTAMLIMLL